MSMINQSKIHDISIMSSKFEDEIKELREQNTVLESKNKKYLDIIGMTASEQQENMRLQVEAAQEALSFSKRAKGLNLVSELDHGEMVKMMEEMEEMLEVQQKENQNYQDKINVLTKDLQSQRFYNEEKALVQQRSFDSLKQLETAKAKVEDELAELKMRLEEVQNENQNLHQVAQDAI